MAKKPETISKTFRLNKELIEKANEYIEWYEKVYKEKISLTSLLEKGLKTTMWNTLENWMAEEEYKFSYDPDGDPNTGYMKRSTNEFAKETHDLAEYTYKHLYPNGDFIDDAEYYMAKRGIDMDYWIALHEFDEDWKETYSLKLAQREYERENKKAFLESLKEGKD